MPRILRRCLPYEESLVLSGGLVNTWDTYTFRTSSVFDPDYNFAGHQPRGFDEISPFYEYYRVVGASCSVTFTWDQSSGYTSGLCCGIAMRDNATVPGTLRDLAESRYKRYKYVTINGVDKATVKYFYSAKKMLGARSIREATAFRSLITTNPADTWYFIICAGPVDLTSTNWQVRANVRINYFVEFQGYRQVAAS